MMLMVSVIDVKLISQQQDEISEGSSFLLKNKETITTGVYITNYIWLVVIKASLLRFVNNATGYCTQLQIFKLGYNRLYSREDLLGRKEGMIEEKSLLFKGETTSYNQDYNNNHACYGYGCDEFFVSLSLYVHLGVVIVSSRFVFESRIRYLTWLWL